MKLIDADKLKAKIEKRKNILDVESPFGIGGRVELELVLDTITSLQQEQPEADLDAEIAIYLNRNVLNRINNSDIIENFTTMEAGELARHFYELGLNARKEETK